MLGSGEMALPRGPTEGADVFAIHRETVLVVVGIEGATQEL